MQLNIEGPQRVHGRQPKGLRGNPAKLDTYDYDLDKARFYMEAAVADGAQMKRAIQFLGY